MICFSYAAFASSSGPFLRARLQFASDQFNGQCHAGAELAYHASFTIGFGDFLLAIDLPTSFSLDRNQGAHQKELTPRQGDRDLGLRG